MGIKDSLLSENLITYTQPSSSAAETYRILRTNIQYTSVDKKVKTIVITSPEINDGKTVTASNLAISIANAGMKVLLIDADLRNPNIHNQFRLPNSIGLTNIIVENSNIEEALYKIEGIKNLVVLTSGTIPPNPAELLTSKKVKDLIHNFSQQFDMVIIDTPPIGLVTDSVILAGIVDGVLLVISAQKTKINSAHNAVKSLKTIGANVLGAVLTKVKSSNGTYYKYGKY